MSLKRRAAGWALIALMLVSDTPFGQQQQSNDMRLDPSGTQPAPTLPVQSPTIVSPTQSGATDKIFYQGPQAPRPPQAPLEREPAASAAKPAPPPERNEYQEFVLKSTGQNLPLFGHNLFDGGPSTFAPLDNIPVPADYVVGPGDEILVRAWGQIDVDVRATVDRNGRIYIPKVGAVSVAAIRYQDLDARVRHAVARTFKNFDMVVTLGELRSIQIFVVGQARKPGSYTVSSLSTLLNAFFASGGPSTKGSMRRVQLKRGDKILTEFDLYDLLLKGDKSRDMSLLPGDVIFVPPVGPLVAISGSVNVPGIYELKQAQTLRDLLTMAGGLATSASGQKVTLERIYERKTRVVESLALDPSGLARLLADGDVVNVFTLSPRIINAVTLRGNVATPTRFPWQKGMRVSDVIPDRSVLVIPDYWMNRNRAGRAQNWLAENATPLDGAGRPKPDLGSRVKQEIKRPGAEVNWDYALIERLNPVDFSTILIPFNLGRAIADKGTDQDPRLEPADIVTIFSRDDFQGPQARQSKFVRLEGELQSSGVYQLLPGETLRQVVGNVGGLTPNAYLYGAEFTRESTRIEQQQRLDESLQRLEVEMQRSGIQRAQGVVDPEQAQSLQAEAQAQRLLLGKLRELKATGRIVLEVKPNSNSYKDLPELVLEDGDRLYVPPRPSTVSVFGAVYNQSAYLYKSGRPLSEYLNQAGGPTKDADRASLYILRADGTVYSKRQSSSGFNSERLYPGDTVIVPEDLNRTSWTREFKDWTQIFYQFALGVVGLKVLSTL